MTSELLEKYRIGTQEPELHCPVQRKRYETMLIGLLPFAEQELFFSTLTPSCAMVLAGGEGCGKRTLEQQFFAQYGEMFTSVLGFPSQELAQSGEDELISGIHSFFASLTDIGADIPTAPKETVSSAGGGTGEGSETESEAASGTETAPPQTAPEGDPHDDDGDGAYMISFGDITAMADMPRASACLASELKKALSDDSAVYIITAVFSGRVRDIPAPLRRVMRVCRIDPPTRDERLAFFTGEMKPLLGYVNDMTGADFMADYTEGLSFSELEELIRELHIFLKAKFITDAAEAGGTDIGEIEMSDIGIDKVELLKEDFMFLADSYKPEQDRSTAPSDLDAISELIASLSAKAETEEEPEEPSPFALIDDEDDPDYV